MRPAAQCAHASDALPVVSGVSLRPTGTEQWTIIGVIVGAIVGGGVQVASLQYDAWDARRDRLRTERQSAYHDLILGVDRWEESLADLLSHMDAHEVELEDSIPNGHPSSVSISLP